MFTNCQEFTYQCHHKKVYKSYMTLVTWINKQLEERNWNRSDLARAAGIDPSALSHIYHGRRTPGIDLCLGIARALSVDPDVVFREAGILPPKGNDTDETAETVYYQFAKLPRAERREVARYINYIYQRHIAETAAGKVTEPGSNGAG